METGFFHQQDGRIDGEMLSLEKKNLQHSHRYAAQKVAKAAGCFFFSFFFLGIECMQNFCKGTKSNTKMTGGTFLLHIIQNFFCPFS